MKRLQFDKLIDGLKRWHPFPLFFTAIKFWIQDIKHAHERCAYCGWYLHPQLLFKGINRPTYMTYWHEENGKHVCSKCHYLNEQLK